MVPLDTLEQIRARFQFLEAKMAGGAEAGEIADLAREYAELKPVVAEIEAAGLADIDGVLRKIREIPGVLNSETSLLLSRV